MYIHNERTRFDGEEAQICQGAATHGYKFQSLHEGGAINEARTYEEEEGNQTPYSEDLEYSLALPWAVGEQPPPPPPGLPPQLLYDHSRRPMGVVIVPPKEKTMFDHFPGLQKVGHVCFVPIAGIFIVIAWIMGKAAYTVLLCFGMLPDPNVDQAKEELRIYSRINFGCDAEDLELVPPRKGAVLPNPHLVGKDSVFSVSLDRPRSRFTQSSSNSSGRASQKRRLFTSNASNTSAQAEDSPEEEDLCPQLAVPHFTPDSCHRWLRWAADLGWIFQTIMKGIKEPNVAEKEEGVARIWAENQWNHWQRSNDPLVVGKGPKVTHEQRVSAVTAALRDLQHASVMHIQNQEMSLSKEISEGNVAGRERYFASEDRLRRYNALLKDIRLNGVFECDFKTGKPPPAPEAPPAIPLPAPLRSTMRNLGDNSSSMGDGTLSLQAGFARSSLVSNSPFGLRRSLLQAM